MPITTSKRQRYDLTIVIPAYHEGKRIGKTLDELAHFLKHESFFRDKEVEVLVVAAETSDDTHKIVLARLALFKHCKLLKPGNRVGKGRDVRFGMLKATGKLVIFMDADLATPLYHLKTFYEACTKGDELVIGTRNLFKHHPSHTRRTISNIGNVLFRLASGIWLEDSQCGFKMFSAYANQICFSKLTLTGWDFDMEVLAIARANGLKIQSYRINDWRSVPGSTFTDGILTISMRSIHSLCHIMLCRIRGVYRS
jgi:dolichyl-phosphate beta-glucosyltransferase